VRIRTIKPEFWQDGKTARELTRDQRLFYIGLWNVADDEGRFRLNVRSLLGDIFPHDEDLHGAFIEDSLRVLADTGRLVMYALDGERFGQLLHFMEHQRINRPTPSRIPPPPKDLSETHGALSDPSVSPQEMFHVGSRKGKGEGEREKERELDAAGTHAELSIWMGDRAADLSAVDRYTQAAIWGIWGPNGTQAHDWKGIGPPRRQAIMGTVILTYAAEGKRGFHRPFFAKILTRAIDDAIASDRQHTEAEAESERACEGRSAAQELATVEVGRLNREGMEASSRAVEAKAFYDDHPEAQHELDAMMAPRLRKLGRRVHPAIAAAALVGVVEQYRARGQPRD